MNHLSHMTLEERSSYREAVKQLPVKSTALDKIDELKRARAMEEYILDSSIDLQAKLPDNHENRQRYRLIHAVMRSSIEQLTRDIKRFHRLAHPPKPSKNKAHLTPEQLSQLKENNPIENFFPTPAHQSSSYRLLALCPFHTEKSPSFTIYLKDNSYYCFGCNKGGDVINFLQSLHKISFKEALAYLK